MKQFILKLYNLWAAFVLITAFLLIFPAVFICIQRKAWHKHTHFFHRIWAWLFFNGIGMPIEIEYQVPLQATKQYIFCLNHASYIDIPITTHILPYFFKYMGKDSLGSIPLFGYMFRNIHISVNRGKLRSRYDALQQSAQALQEGYNLVIYPEGGFSQHPPQLANFKEGAFRLAIEHQVPIVPISMPFNYLVMPDKEPLRLYRRKMKIIVHAPIETSGLSLQDIEQLKLTTKNIIQDTINYYHENKF